MHSLDLGPDSIAERNQAKGMELMLKGMISEMPAADQAKVLEAAGEIRALLVKYESQGFIAFSLVGAELAGKV